LGDSHSTILRHKAVCVVYCSGTAAKLRGFSDRPLFQQFCVVLQEQSRDLLLASLTRNPQTVTESSIAHYSLTQQRAWDIFLNNYKGRNYQIIGCFLHYLVHVG